MYNVTEHTKIYTLSLHDALPISSRTRATTGPRWRFPSSIGARATGRRSRSEEHTSELQSQFHLVCRLLLEKKKSSVTFGWADVSTPVPTSYRMPSSA